MDGEREQERKRIKISMDFWFQVLVCFLAVRMSSWGLISLLLFKQKRKEKKSKRRKRVKKNSKMKQNDSKRKGMKRKPNEMYSILNLSIHITQNT